jgi:hypothetical protein
MGPPRCSPLNVPQYPLRVLLGARQVAPGVEQLTLTVLDGVRPILEQSNLTGKARPPLAVGPSRRATTPLHV